MSVKKKLIDYEKIINERFHEKYYLEPNYFNIIKIENIIYNDKTHLVSEFREQMIINDIFEFFSKYYTTSEIPVLLNRCLSYYEKQSFIYPNYIGLPEGKYLYKNIIDKQNLLDDQIRNYGDNLGNKKNNEKNDNNYISNKKIFDNSVYESIMKGSSFSVLDIRKNNDKLDSINDINNLIIEIENKNNQNIFNTDNEKNNKIYLAEKENNKVEELNRINNTFQNKYMQNLKNLFDNKIKEINKINAKEKVNNFNSIYIKSNIRKKLLNNRKNPNDKYIDIKNDTLLTLLNKTQNKTIINNITYKQKNFIYRKCSPINTNNKLSFSTKGNNINFKKELLKNYGMNNNNGLNKRPELNIEVYSYVNKPNNIVNYTVKNQFFNNDKINYYENKTPIKGNKNSMIKRKINTEVNVENKNKTKNFLDILARENAIYIFNNNCINKQNLNINAKKIDISKKINLNKNKSSSQKDKKKANKVSKKMKSFNYIINSIRKKIKKESKINISQRIIKLMKSKKELNKVNQANSNNELNKHIISLKKFMQMKKIKNKLTLTLEESELKNLINGNSKSKTLYNREFKNSNHSQNMIKINAPCKIKNNATKKLNKYILSNITSPSPVKNKIFDNFNSIKTIKNNRNNRVLNTEKKILNFKNYAKSKINLLPNSSLINKSGINKIKLLTKQENIININTNKNLPRKSNNNNNKINIITNKIRRNILNANNNINGNSISKVKLKGV